MRVLQQGRRSKPQHSARNVTARVAGATLTTTLFTFEKRCGLPVCDVERMVCIIIGKFETTARVRAPKGLVQTHSNLDTLDLGHIYLLLEEIGGTRSPPLMVLLSFEAKWIQNPGTWCTR